MYFVCTGGRGACTCHGARVGAREVVGVGSCPFYRMGLGDGTQVVRPSGKHLYPLSLLSSQSKTLFKRYGKQLVSFES